MAEYATTQEIGALFEDLEAAGLDQQALAQAAGLSEGTLSRYKSGGRRCYRWMLEKLRSDLAGLIRAAEAVRRQKPRAREAR